MSTVGQAKVVFEAETGQVSDQLVAALETAMAKVDKILARMSQATETEGKKAGAGLADGLEDGAQRAGKAVDGIDGSGLTKVQEAAAKAGDAVSSKIAEGATRADAAMGSIDGGGLDKAAEAAEKTGRKIGTDIPAGARAADAALDAIDGAGLGKVTTAAEKASTATEKVGSEAIEAGQKARTAGETGASGFRVMDGSIGSVLSKAGRLGGAFAAVAGPAAILKGGFDRLMNIQRAEIMFQSIGLSAEQTKDQMARLSEQVTGTSVSLADAAKYSAMFAQSGVELGAPMDNAIQAFTSLSSIAEGSGVDVGRVLQQISANGKLTGEDLAQMADAGVNASKYLADYLGLPQEEIKKLVSDGKVSFEDFVGAVNQGTGDLAKQMGQTLPAKISNLKTALSNLGAAVIEPFIPGITAAVEFGIALVKGVVGPIKAVVGWFKSGSVAAQALIVVLKAIGLVVAAAALGWGLWAAQFILWPAIVGAATAATGAFAGVMSLLTMGLTALRTALMGLWTAFLANPIAWVIVGIASLVAAFVILWKRSEAFRDFWTGLWNTISDPVRQAIDAVKAAWDGLVGIFRGDTGEEGRSALARLIGVDKADWIISAVTTVKGVWADLKTAFSGGEVEGGGALARLVGIDTAERIMEIIGSIKGAWGELWAAFQGDGSGTDALTALLGDEGRAELVVNLFARLGDAARFVWDTIKQVGQALADVGASIASAGWETIKAVFSGLVEVGKALWSAISEIALAVWDLIQALAPVLLPILKVVGAVVGGIIVAAFFVLMGALRLVAGLFQILAGVISWLAENVLSPLIGVIAEVVGWLVDKLGGAISGVVDFVTMLFQGIGAVFSWVWEQLQAAWENVGRPVLDFILMAFQFWWESVQLGWRLLQATFEVIWTALQMAWDAWGRPVLDVILAAFQWAWGNLQIVFGWIKAGWDLLWAGVRWVYDTIIAPVIAWISAKFDEMRARIDLALRLVRNVIQLAADKVAEFYATYVQPMVDNVVRGFNRVRDTVTGWKDKLVSALSGAGSWLVSAGRNVVQGFINGIKSLAGTIGSAFLDMVPGWIKGPFKKALGIASPSRLFAEYGRNIGEGLVAGVGSMEGAVQASTQGLADSAANITLPSAPAVAAAPVVTAGAAPAIAADSSAGITEAYSGIAAQMGATSTGLLDPMWMGQSAQMMGLGTTMTTQAQGVIAPSWDAMAAQMAATQAGVITPTMAGAQAAVSQTAATFMGQIVAVIAPALQYLVTMLFWTLNSGVNPVFAGIRGGLQHVVTTFQWAVSAIGMLWAQVREATARPVRFTINSVFNDGVVGMWNSVSDLLGTTKMSPYPVRFATGGYVRGPGGPTGDKIPALLSDREYVLNAKAVERIGVQNLHAINSGSVGAAPNALRSTRQLDGMLDDHTFKQIASRYAGGGIVEGSPAWKDLLRGYKWAQSRSGRPYVFGGSAHGAGGTDCSGYMSGIANVILGGDGRRQWATGNFPTGQVGSWAPGLASGFAVGIRNGGPGGGHTAGTIGGVPGIPAVNVESGGSPSRVKFGAGAVGATDGYFNQHHHLRVVDGGRFVPGSGAGVSMQDLTAEAMKPFKDKLAASLAKYTAGAAGRLNAQYPAAVKEKLVSATQKKIDKLMEEMNGDPGGVGAERWRPMVKRAYARQRYEWTKAKEDAWIRQIQSESGGNPNIAQQIVDINGTGEAAGVGLGQMIPSTWAAYRDPALPNDRRNPWAMINAMVRYGEQKYGSRLLSVIGHGHGYAHGGLMGEGQGMFHKTAFGPERVLSPRQTESFERLVDWIDRQPSLPIQPVPTRGTAEDYGRATKTVLVTQNIIADDPKGAADAVEDRLMGLLT